MEYKSNVIRINDVILKPEKYVIADRTDAVAVTIEALLNERMQIKKQMDEIVHNIEEL